MMPSQLKGRLFAFVSAWTYFVFAAVFYFSSKPLSSSRTHYMVLLSIASLIWAILLYRRIRLIEDTSDTLLNSAAQGYVEVKGKVSLYEGETIRGLGLDLPPMVWYQNVLTVSSAGFILEDDKGRCTIDPRDAEVITPLHNYGNRFYHAIYPSESIYVLGQLETLKKHKTEYERNGLVTSKVIEWKKDKSLFLDYFDTNKDGKIDAEEMAVAKDAAVREVDYDVEEDYQKPPTHVISSPEDGRPFLLSSIHPDMLVRRYTIMIAAHLFTWLYLSVLVLLS